MRIPLVLHGASGVPDEAIRMAIERGIAKVNIATELKIPWVQSLRDTLAKDLGEIDPRRVMAPARDAVKKVIREEMRLFGSAGRAKS